MKKIKLVIDTNVILVSISSKSKYHWIFKKLLEQKYSICVTESILYEYEEIISKKFSKTVAKNFIRTLLLLPNVEFVKIFYEWGLIRTDKDDNKFVDCAISSNADYILTEDNHFNQLQKIDFPKVNVININKFFKIIKGENFAENCKNRHQRK